MPLREVRAQIGHLVDRAEHHGETTIITRHGRPVARIAPMNVFTYAIEVSADGEVWAPETDAAIGTERTDDTAEQFARDVLKNWVDDLPADAKGGHRRVVVWEGEQQDAIDMAAYVLTDQES